MMNYLFIYNLCIQGNTIREILNRFDFEAKFREPDTLIFQAGLNDSKYFDDNKNNPNVSLEEFSKNIMGLIITARKYSKKYFLLD